MLSSQARAVELSRQAFAFLLGCAAIFVGTAYALDRTLPHPFREYGGIEYRVGSIPLPPDFSEKTEWAFARLMFPAARSTVTLAVKIPTGARAIAYGRRTFRAPIATSLKRSAASRASTSARSSSQSISMTATISTTGPGSMQCR